ncbi:MAG: hypothetical protein ACREIT_05605 [Tepidisphaeraceae bacterium]
MGAGRRTGSSSGGWDEREAKQGPDAPPGGDERLHGRRGRSGGRVDEALGVGLATVERDWAFANSVRRINVLIGTNRRRHRVRVRRCRINCGWSRFITMIQLTHLTLFVVPLLLLAAGAGCANYEFDIVRPPEFARHIGRKGDTVFERDGLEYRMISYQNRLAVSVYNHGDDTIQLVGQRSSVVDPGGRSHPLRSQTIAPHSYVRFLLPPERPRVDSGPRVGVGMGIGTGGRRGGFGGVGVGTDVYDHGGYVEDDSAYYWDWQGEGEVRFTIVYQRDEQTFEHDFVVRRGKV